MPIAFCGFLNGELLLVIVYFVVFVSMTKAADVLGDFLNLIDENVSAVAEVLGNSFGRVAIFAFFALHGFKNGRMIL